jgi:transcriptional regulator with XRE-family HTH domain
MKTAERERARILRSKHGLSIRDITQILGVSKSSVSLWVRDIELSAAQIARLHERNPACNPERNGAATQKANGLARRLEYQTQGRVLARRDDAFHAAGCMLYWAEGSRRRNAVVFVNSDPAMMRYFARFLRRCFAVPNEKFRVRCNLFADHLDRQREIEQFWLDVLGVPRTCLTKSAVNVYSKYSKKKRRNKLPYGTCSLTVHDTQIAQSIYGAIQEYGGFEREEWVM